MRLPASSWENKRVGITGRSKLKTAAWLVCSLALLAHPLSPGSEFPALACPYLGQELPGNTPVLFAPAILNSRQGYHSSIVFSPDLREAVWCPMREQGGGLFMAKMSEGKWQAPLESDFGMAAGVLDPIFSVDGNKLFFLSFQPDQPGGSQREKIWFVERTPGGWSQPRLIDEVVQSHPTHWTFSLARNGNLYFTSEISGEQDIYVARFDGRKYLAPENLGAAVNGGGKNFAPFIAPDEGYLIFARLGAETQKADLYITYKMLDGSWSRARDMGPRVNSAGHDLAPYVSPDGLYLFFVSQRERRNGIYWLKADIIHELRPTKFEGAAD
jgi:hypothetical protein